MTGNSPKTYTLREEICSSAVHGAGILFALIAFFPLFARAMASRDPLFAAGVIYYALTLLLMFVSSTCYHLIRDPKKKENARQADHCAIYFLISGSYAPLMLGAVKTATGYGICLTLFLLALAGTAGKIRFGQKFHRFEVILYLLMGWCCVIVAVPLMRVLSRQGLILLLSGGAAYSAGVFFYIQKWEFSHAVWHFFVLAGAVLHCFVFLTI